MKFRAYALIFLLFLSGCALTPKIEIDVRDPKFSLDSSKKFGVIKFDIWSVQPYGTSDAVASQFGLLGAAVTLAVKSGQKSFDNSIDEQGIALRQRSLALLKERFDTSHLVLFFNAPEPDDLTLSKQIRDVRFWGSSAPSEKEIAKSIHDHSLDYVLYSKTWCGIRKVWRGYWNDGGLYVSTEWKIYDRAGHESFSAFVRSVDSDTIVSKLTPSTETDKLLNLFSDNLTRLVSAITTSSR